MKKTKFSVTIDEKGKLLLELSSGATIRIFESNNSRFALKKGEIFFLTKKSQIIMIAADKKIIPKLEFDKVIVLDPKAYEIDTAYLEAFLLDKAQEASMKLAVFPERIKLPSNVYTLCSKAADEFLLSLEAFGFKLAKKKTFSAKAQHRWKKAISDIPFHIKHEGTSGTVIWQKSTEMRLLAGAKMLPNDAAPKRADGTLGFTAKFALNLREENKEKFNPETWTTTADIILRSVNELGHFLYFAGTNSWLEMFDEEGRSIHELSVVN
ncbi:hypothetical protein ET006_04805 [Lactococcus garvieae]|uniref:hypothetical protein n=1 Tax=Lactococcus formosensis TaxID=1281486 RepID=UPI0013FDE865|nr:hypothetical protein [Lactococcus garvieae]NHI99733.1 hypothetical protein [Lactococcus garvieae]NHJ18292.1 hypothetical protein [Lactococcus garvieae]